MGTFVFLILEEKHYNLTPLNMMLAVGLSYVDFIVLRYVSSIPDLFMHIIKGETDQQPRLDA